MILRNKKILFVLYNYPLSVSTMLINTIAMLQENNNEVVVFSNNDIYDKMGCEYWLSKLFFPVNKNKIQIDNQYFKLLGKIYRRVRRRFFKWFKKNTINNWETKYSDLYKYSKKIKKYLEKNECDIIMAIETYSLLAIDSAVKNIEINSDIFFFDMELLDWSENNPLYDDKLELKKRQVKALSNVDKVIITSYNRAKIFSDINSYPINDIFVLPVVPRKRIINKKSNYFRKKFQICDNTKIVLYSGNFVDWAQCKEIIESMKNWPNNVVLVMHTWNKMALESEYFKEMNQAAKNYPVFFSSDFLNYKDMGEALSSADIGIFYYKEIDDNFTEICFSSNKMGEYLASGLPIICSPFPSLIKFVEKNEIGFSVSHNDIGQSINNICVNIDKYKKNVEKCVRQFLVFDTYYNDAFLN